MYIHGRLYKIPSTLMRGGTSKGLIIKDQDLPSNEKVRERVITSIFGSSENGQIDGVGGGTSLTSKLAIVGPTHEMGCDIFYKFGQVSVNKNKIDYKVTCGNMASAVGLFAVEEGLVELVEPVTTVRIFNENTKRVMEVEIMVEDGNVVLEGDFKISGVTGTSSPIMVHFIDFGGSITGNTLPTGNATDLIELDDGSKIEVTFLDVGNILIFIDAEILNLDGSELSNLHNHDLELKQKIESIRVKCGRLLGLFSEDEIVTAQTHALPKIVIVSKAKNYVNENNQLIEEKDIDIVGRYITMGNLHRAFAVSGAIGLGVASKIPETIPNKLSKNTHNTSVIIGHPTGSILVDVKIAKESGRWTVKKAGIGRTARRIMDGNSYVPVHLLDSYTTL